MAGNPFSAKADAKSDKADIASAIAGMGKGGGGGSPFGGKGGFPPKGKKGRSDANKAAIARKLGKAKK